VRIGTGVTEPIRRHPATLAQAFVTLDHMTGGRAICGIGNGERENTEPYGLPFTKRVARLEEALEIMQRLWRSGGEPVDFDGAFWRLRQALFTTPLYAGRPPAVWVAAHAPRMLGVTGRYATGWYPTMKLTADDYRARLGVIRTAAAEVGRDFASFEPALQIMVALGDRRDAVLERVSRVPTAAALGMLLPGPLWTRHGLRHPLGETFEGFPEFVPEQVTDAQLADAQRQVTPALLGDGVFAGSVDEIEAEIRPLVAAGLQHVVVMNVGPIATGAGPREMLALAQLIRRLRRIPSAGIVG
jgi:phthiodiolone/phenolphthiodiolone dimycocerosates ketoreductase